MRIYDDSRRPYVTSGSDISRPESVALRVGGAPKLRRRAPDRPHPGVLTAHSRAERYDFFQTPVTRMIDLESDSSEGLSVNHRVLTLVAAPLAAESHLAGSGRWCPLTGLCHSAA